jgi:hypothetical protein
MSSTTDLIARGVDPSELTSVDRDDAIKIIREALRRRSGKSWSVKGDRGTAWGWINITAPPKRRVAHLQNPAYNCDNPEPGALPYFEISADEDHGAWYMSDADAAELGKLLGFNRPVHCQGVSIAAASDYRREYIARALGLNPLSHGVQYWD